MTYKPIQCSRYDYIEIACMRSYALNITLLSGETVLNAIAKDTQIINKEEFLIININGNQQKIRLDKIKTLSVLDENTEFSTVTINDD